MRRLWARYRHWRERRAYEALWRDVHWERAIRAARCDTPGVERMDEVIRKVEGSL